MAPVVLSHGLEKPLSETSFSRLRSSYSVADNVVDQIEAEISEHQLAPGHRIGTKQDLCEQFGIAPATLGEAMRVLRARGVIEVRPGPGGGIFVADQSPLLRLAHSVRQLRERGATVNDVVGVLNALDDAVIRDAAAHRTKSDLKELDALMDELAAVWSDPTEGLHCNWQLHRRIAQISPNEILRTFYVNLVDYIEGEARGETNLDVPGFSPSSDERLHIHYDLVAAIRSQEEKDLTSAILRHRSLGGASA